MSQNPLVSVLMTTYNRRDYLPGCIESILNQTYGELELIIVDDGSTDDSPAYLASLEDPRVRVITLPENRHISTATNAGLSVCRGDYLAYMDSDDLWRPEKLEKQLAVLTARPELGACFTWVDLINEEGVSINDILYDLHGLYASPNYSQEEWLRFCYRTGCRLSKPSALIPMEAARRVGLHNYSYVQLHDFDWWVRLLKLYPIHVLPEELTRMRRFSSESSNASGYDMAKLTRSANEGLQIRKHFFDDMEDALFIRAFSQDFRNPNARTSAELSCEKAFLLLSCSCEGSVLSSPGLEKLAELLEDPETRTVLEEVYHYSTLDFYRDNQKAVYSDPEQVLLAQQTLLRTEDELAQARQYIKNLEEVNKEGYRKLYEANETIRFREDHIAALKEQSAYFKNLWEESEAGRTRTEAELSAVSDTLKDTKELLENTQKELLDAREELSSVFASRSWKLTAPLRALKKS